MFQCEFLNVYFLDLIEAHLFTKETEMRSDGWPKGTQLLGDTAGTSTQEYWLSVQMQPQTATLNSFDLLCLFLNP